MCLYYLAVNPGALSSYAMNWLLGWYCEGVL